MSIRTVSPEEIIHLHQTTRPVSVMLVKDLEARLTADKDSYLIQQRIEETRQETGGWDGYETYGGTDRYGAIVQDALDTPSKTLGVGGSMVATPYQRTPGLRPEDLNLWSSGIHSSNSQQKDADDTSEEARLLARLAEINAKKQGTSQECPSPNSVKRSTYNQIDLWGTP